MAKHVSPTQNSFLECSSGVRPSVSTSKRRDRSVSCDGTPIVSTLLIVLPTLASSGAD